MRQNEPWLAYPPDQWAHFAEGLRDARAYIELSTGQRADSAPNANHAAFSTVCLLRNLETACREAARQAV